MSDKEQDSNFEVIISKADNDTTVVTTPLSMNDERVKIAISQYDPENKKYSAYLKDGTQATSIISIKEIDDLATNTQNNLSKVMRINDYNRKLINKNDIVGKTVESIDTNINTDIKLVYANAEEGRNKKKRFDEYKRFINDFNSSVRIEQLTRNAVTTSYIEGNWIAYLRHEDKNNYIVDIYPLGVCEISDTMINGEPLVLFNIRELRNRLQKVYRKTKSKKPLIFKDMDEEIRVSYPPEVYKAYKDNEDYAKLDYRYTGVVRIGNLNRKYGVSPILRAYADLAMLDTFADADRVNSKAKAKKIIHQKMRKEVMGQDYNKDFFPELSYAHLNFMNAFKQNTVVVTSPPTVESIAYVEPKVEMTSKDTYNIYRSKVLSTLGIQFLMDTGSQSVSTASISVTQLMRTINTITEQLEDIYEKWYKQITLDNGYPLDFAPNVNVIDSEQLEADIKQSLATLLFSTMNSSYETAFEILGMDVNDEVQKRIRENEKNFDDIFKPHGSQYTSSSNNSVGRPSGDSNNVETNTKQQYDKEYNKDARGG